jgi:transcriptional regulator
MTLYNPEHFRKDDPESQVALMQAYGFATLVASTTAGELFVSHVPLSVERDAEGRVRLQGHVSRHNPQWQMLPTAQQVLAIFEGPHAYVSPSWYGHQPSVPTWNYAVVHASGKARLLDGDELHALVLELSNQYELGREKPWRASELPPAYLEGMLQGIVGFEITVERLEGKFKLSQNRPAEVARVASALDADGAPEVAALMREQALSKA